MFSVVRRYFGWLFVKNKKSLSNVNLYKCGYSTLILFFGKQVQKQLGIAVSPFAVALMLI